MRPRPGAELSSRRVPPAGPSTCPRSSAAGPSSCGTCSNRCSRSARLTRSIRSRYVRPAVRRFDRLAQEVRQGAVVVAVDVGIGGHLVRAAAGDQDGAALSGAGPEAPDGQFGQARARQRGGRADAAMPRAGRGAGGLSQSGARMAAVEHHGQVHAGRQVLHDRVQVVIGERVIPVEVVRADDLVQPVVALVAIPIGHLRAVAGVMEDEHVARARAVEQPVEPVDDGRGRGTRVGEQPNRPVRGESEPRVEQVAHLPDVVDAPSERVLRIRVAVETDEQRLPGHGTSSRECRVRS